MLARGLGARLELLLLPPVLVDSHSLALVHTFSRVPWGTTGRQGGVKNGSLIVFKIESYKEEGHPPAGCPSCIRGIGCGAWIRTKDLRVMSRLEGAAVSDAPPQLYSKPSPAVV